MKMMTVLSIGFFYLHVHKIHPQADNQWMRMF
jgi:hypothetical protein